MNKKYCDKCDREIKKVFFRMEINKYVTKNGYSARCTSLQYKSKYIEICKKCYLIEKYEHIFI